MKTDIADTYVVSVAATLKTARSKQQVEIILQQAMEQMAQTDTPSLATVFRSRLQGWLENLSPLDWDSQQWACLRHAFLYLKGYAVAEMA